MGDESQAQGRILHKLFKLKLKVLMKFSEWWVMGVSINLIQELALRSWGKKLEVAPRSSDLSPWWPNIRVDMDVERRLSWVCEILLLIFN